MRRAGRLKESLPSSLLLWKLLPELRVSGNWTLSFYRLLGQDKDSDRKEKSRRQKVSLARDLCIPNNLGVSRADLLPGTATKAVLKGPPERRPKCVSPTEQFCRLTAHKRVETCSRHSAGPVA